MSELVRVELVDQFVNLVGLSCRAEDQSLGSATIRNGNVIIGCGRRWMGIPTYVAFYDVKMHSERH